MRARIYQPSRNAMQSGMGKTHQWVLEFAQSSAREVDPLMGWTSSSDMKSQLKLWFDSEAEAVAYATRNGIAYRVEQPNEARRRTISYSDNFKFTRVGQWTH